MVCVINSEGVHLKGGQHGYLSSALTLITHWTDAIRQCNAVVKDLEKDKSSQTAKFASTFSLK